MLFVCHPKFCISIVFSFSWGHCNSQEKLKTMPMQNFGVKNKEHYGMLWHFWSGQFFSCLIKKVVRDLQPIKMGNNLNQSICFKFFSVFDPKQFYKIDN